MFKIIIFFLILIASTARIFNGSESIKNEFPFVVAIIGIDETNIDEPIIYTCGGTILDSTHILTAASCFYNS